MDLRLTSHPYPGREDGIKCGGNDVFEDGERVYTVPLLVLVAKVLSPDCRDLRTFAFMGGSPPAKWSMANTQHWGNRRCGLFT